MDAIVLDELGYLPSSKNVGQLLFHLPSKTYKKTSTLITARLTFAKWPPIFGDAGMAPSLLDRMTHHCHIVETGEDSWRMKNDTLLRAFL
jgi:DNA replication protein DnaC